VNGTRDDFFTGSALPSNQDLRVGLGNTLDLLPEITDECAGTDE
jgi:hypothetical protein